jgi:hypothetical protein
VIIPFPFVEEPADHDISGLLAMLSTVIEDKQAVYLSTPITSGPQLLQRHYSGKGAALERDAAHEPGFPPALQSNLAAAAKKAHELRTKRGFLVIAPILFSQEGWTQPNYRYFWGLVLERFVNKVYFMHGWEYSSGCSYEFFVASKLELETYRQDGSLFSTQEGLAALNRASDEMQRQGLSAEIQRAVAAALADTTVAEG